VRPAGASPRARPALESGLVRREQEIKEATKLEDMEAPEIVSFNEAALDVEELEARLEIASMVPNDDCWMYCGCNCLILICN
jgi:hypothetical protein